MKYVRYFLVSFLAAFFAINASYALLGETYDAFKSIGNESNLVINFTGSTYWVDWMEGGSGGGNVRDYLRIRVIDAGLEALPQVYVFNNTQLWFNFSMSEGETAYFWVRQNQNGNLIKEARVTDKDPAEFFSKAEYTFYQPGCSQTVQKVQIIPNSNSLAPWVDKYVGAIFTKYSTCTQKVILI